MLRITGGIWRGQKIITPKNLNTRPTQSKLREALFNVVQSTLPGSNVLDLFAGSGALGFEALSRGAEKATFVEQSHKVSAIIQQNAEHFKVEPNVNIFCQSALAVQPKYLTQAPFDLVFADPPYQKGWELKLLESICWQDVLAEHGIFSLESSSRDGVFPEKINGLTKTREKVYGDTLLTTFIKGDME